MIVDFGFLIGRAMKAACVSSNQQSAIVIHQSSIDPGCRLGLGLGRRRSGEVSFSVPEGRIRGSNRGRDSKEF